MISPCRLQVKDLTMTCVITVNVAENIVPHLTTSIITQNYQDNVDFQE